MVKPRGSHVLLVVMLESMITLTMALCVFGILDEQYTSKKTAARLQEHLHVLTHQATASSMKQKGKTNDY